jgi:hypothetical protein
MITSSEKMKGTNNSFAMYRVKRRMKEIT